MVIFLPMSAIAANTAANLNTAPTYYDQSGVWRAEDNRVLDIRDGRIESVSQLNEGPFQGTPEVAARAFLYAHKDWVGLDPTEANLRVARVADSPMGKHVTFERVINGVRVYPGNMVVTLNRDNRVLFYFSSVSTFKGNVGTVAKLSAEQAKDIATQYLKPTGQKTYSAEPELVIWAGDNHDFAACWLYHVNYTEPYGDWEVLVDASNGQIRRVKDISEAVDGAGYVFDPDPITTSGVSYGATGFTDNNNANSTQLNAQRTQRTLRDIGSYVQSGTTYYNLTGLYCTVEDIELPTIAPVLQANNSNFNYNRSQNAFEDCMVYFHIDQNQRYMRSLGYTSVQNNSIHVDPHAENYGCNAHYHPSGNYLTFADGTNDVDAAEDAEVVLHEYGHGIQNSIVPGWGGGDEGAMGEGWGDYWGGSYGRSVNPNWQQYWVVSWGLHNCFGGRSLQAGLHYPEDAGQEVHYSGELWSQALTDAEVNIGDRSVMNIIGLQHHYLLGTTASMLTAANAIVTTDLNLYGGRHLSAIANSFVPRGLMTRPNPQLDTCPGWTVTSLPYTFSGSTAAAGNDFATCVGVNSPDVIFTYTATSCQVITVSLCGSGYDTGLDIRGGGACPGTSPLACNDDFCGNQSQASFAAITGETYYIIVHGYSTCAGPFTLNMSGTPLHPSNDACPGREITSLPFTESGNTSCAVRDYTHVINSTSPEVVYSYTPTSCQNVTASLCGSDFDTGLEVRAGGSCPGTTLITSNDDNYCGSTYTYQSTATFEAFPGITYYFLVYGYDTESGPFTFNVTGTPVPVPNDACPGTGITSLPYTDSGDTRCAVNNFTHCVYGTSPDVLYNLTLPTCQTVTVSLCGSGFDTGLEIRAGGTCPGSTQIACDDDYCGSFGPSQATFVAQAGVTYYVIVEGYNTAAGPYSLNVTGTPYVQPNDACPGTAISALPYTDSGTTVCAAHDFAHYDGGASHDVLYTFTSTSSQTVTASLCGSNFDTEMEVRVGGACPGQTMLTWDDDYCAALGASQVQFIASAGTTYYILVYGWNGAQGAYTLNVTGAPYSAPNDACPGTAISSLPFTDRGNTACATNNTDINCVNGDGPDVFYSLTLNSCQTVTASLCGSAYDTGLEIRMGGSCPGTTQVACDDDALCGGTATVQSSATWNAIAGVTYYIIIDGYLGTSGNFVLNVSGVPFIPANDVCPGTAVVSLPFSDMGDTRCAATDYTTPNCVYQPAHDVFYNITLPTCQMVTVSTCGSGFDTGVEIRSGGTCPGTTPVTCVDDAYCGTVYTTQATAVFQAAAGVTYYAIVTGYNSAAGALVVNITGAPCVQPSHPDSLVAQVSLPNINLYWSHVTNATGYNIYRAITPDVPLTPANLIGQSSTPNYVDANVVGSGVSRYFYAVTTVSGSSLRNDADSNAVASVNPTLDKSAAIQPEVADFVAYASQPSPAVDKAEAEQHSSVASDYVADPAKLRGPVRAQEETVFVPVYANLTSPYVGDLHKSAEHSTALAPSNPFLLYGLRAEVKPEPSDKAKVKTAGAGNRHVFVPVYTEFNTQYVPNPGKRPN